ncbi:MAG: CHC2 zinc finger domain-containing protein, partial [Clostridia bacterium]
MFGEKIDLDRYINYEVKYETQLKKVKRSPNGLQALCPFHEDTNASFSVDSKTGRYNCFACGAKGNYIDFVANIKHIETDEAYKMILKDIGKYEEPKQKYTIEEYSDAKKLPVIFLKENFEISTFREGIKIPYKDETGMQTATRYRYANKKFLWSKGSKVGLYGLHLLNSIRSKGYVVLVEGESDTHTLWLHGIPALGVPGATTFQETWVKYFEGIDIYIHHEGDTGADTFIKKTSEALFHKGFENDVYKITCRCVDVKDPSDLHIKNKTEFEKKFNMVMSQKEKLDIKALAINVEETIPGAPITLRQPILWRIDKSGIYYLGSKDGLDILVCKTPILLFNRMHSLDTGEEKIEIAYLRDNKWRYAIYPRSTIFQSRTIVQLADIGITVTSENSKMLVKFLGALEAENMDVLNLKKSVSQLGWYGNKFLPCKKDDLIIDVDRASQKWINAYTEQG